EAGARSVAGALAGLGGEEELVAARRQPRRQPQLGVAVAGRGVEVVHTELEQHVEQFVSALLPHPAQRGGTEDDPAAAMPGAPERGLRDHGSSTTRPT